MSDDDMREAPPAVIGAVAAGVGPTPFLAVYAVLFIAHGVFHPVQPPDITTTRGGEAAAGVIASVLLLAMIVTIFWFLNGRRRWPFVVGQLATLVTSIDFIVDSSTGSPAVPAVLGVTSAAALVCAFLPQSWDWVGARFRLPGRPRGAAPVLGAVPVKHVPRRALRAAAARSAADPDPDPDPDAPVGDRSDATA